MPTITATLYKPGQPPQLLSAAQRSLLSITLGKQLVAHTRTVADYLGVKEADLLYAGTHCAAWGLVDAQDYERIDHNPEAEQALYGATGEQSELYGPILIITAE